MVENVLLKNSCVVAESFKDIFAVKVFVNRTLNPNVNGHTVDAVISEQCNAICNLITNAANRL